MTNALTVNSNMFTQEKIQLLKDTIAKETSNDELALFLYVCEHTGLDPFLKQIYPVMRWNADLGRKAMVIQTGIDGYRLIADRTGKYAGGSDYEYGPEENGHPTWARVTVYKIVDGVTHSTTSTARWNEYAQKKKDGSLFEKWRNMPYLMLGKCAEALALRRAFPAELSGLYTSEEMEQADSERPVEIKKEVKKPNDVVEAEFEIVDTDVPVDQKLIEQDIVRGSNKEGLKNIGHDHSLPVDLVDGEPALNPKFDRGQKLNLIQGILMNLKKKDPKKFNGYWESGHLKKHYNVQSKSDMTEEQLNKYQEELAQLLLGGENVSASSN